jgi:hypothetical protein
MARADPEVLAKIESSINRELLLIIPLLILSVVIPTCAWHGVLQQDASVSIWFQRSGSLTVLFAVWAEYKIFKIRALTNPMSDGGETWQDLAHQGALKTKYKKMLAVINFISVTLVIIGTLIWGYGDLFKGA